MANIKTLGSKVKGGWTIDSTQIKKITYVREEGNKVPGCHVVSEIERLSDNDVLVDRDADPMTIFVPNSTLSKIRAPRRTGKSTKSEQEALANFDVPKED